MNSYEYKCRICETYYEFPTNSVDFRCCGIAVRRTYSFGGISFKGNGFYVNEKGK